MKVRRIIKLSIILTLTVLASVNITLIVSPEILIPNDMPGAKPFPESGNRVFRESIKPEQKNDVDRDRLLPDQLKSMFNSNIPAFVTEEKQVPEKTNPVDYDMNRLIYLGYVKKDEDTIYMFKDTFYNDVLKLSEGETSGGFSLIDISDSGFYLRKEEDFFLVKKSK